MTIRRLLLPLLLIAAPSAADDPVWDPVEIARVAQEGAQMAVVLSATAAVQRQLTLLAAGLGAAGAAGSGLLLPPGPDPLAGLALSSAMAPSVAAQQGLALAQTANQSLANSAARGQTLAGVASAAVDLRGDVQSDSAAALAVLAQATIIEALLALLVQGQAAQQLALSP